MNSMWWTIMTSCVLAAWSTTIAFSGLSSLLVGKGMSWSRPYENFCLLVICLDIGQILLLHVTAQGSESKFFLLSQYIIILFSTQLGLIDRFFLCQHVKIVIFPFFWASNITGIVCLLFFHSLYNIFKQGKITILWTTLLRLRQWLNFVISDE